MNEHIQPLFYCNCLINIVESWNQFGKATEWKCKHTQVRVIHHKPPHDNGIVAPFEVDIIDDSRLDKEQ